MEDQAEEVVKQMHQDLFQILEQEIHHQYHHHKEIQEALELTLQFFKREEVVELRLQVQLQLLVEEDQVEQVLR
jgi:hypothetical protein